MIESEHAIHKPTNLPVFSLYSETRQPTSSMVEKVDTLLIDIQIVGCRVYTFKYTIAACLRAAKLYGKKVVILDRPNPLGGQITEGRVLETAASSFVGEFSIPMRHGLTPGEIAKFFNKEIGASLEVVSMEGWKSDWQWPSTDLPWVLTSPNLPSIESVFVYPGTVLFEGTNVSEGRGTGLPFQFLGAPYITDERVLTKRVRELYGKGDEIYLRETQFKPTSQKWADTLCMGFQIHVLDPLKLRSFDLGLACLRAFIELGGDKFKWKQPPYEYDYKTLPIKLILGSHDVVENITSSSFNIRDEFWSAGIKDYITRVSDSFIYPRANGLMTVDHLL